VLPWFLSGGWVRYFNMGQLLKRSRAKKETIRQGWKIVENTINGWSWYEFFPSWMLIYIKDILIDNWDNFQAWCASLWVPFSSIINFLRNFFWKQNLRYTPVTSTNRSLNRRNTLHILNWNTDWSNWRTYFRENIRNENAIYWRHERALKDYLMAVALDIE
jgi:hypothetical protein